MSTNPIITLAHGGGGTRTQSLIKNCIMKHLGNPTLARLDDAAVLTMPSADIVMTTDSYVITPLFFPGGDIGKLAVCGTLNDLTMQGARPRYLSLALIIEEGFSLAELDTIIQSAAQVCKAVGVDVVTGDTKVVERGKGNGLFINTAGIGEQISGIDVHVGNAKPGDAIIVSGTIGDHGMAIMSRREGIKIDSELVSDTAALWPMIEPLLQQVPAVRCLRDPTRGGLAAALCDIASSSKCGVRIKEQGVPVKTSVQGVCDLLGIDPLQVANEGKAVIICPEDKAAAVLNILKKHPLGADACSIGRIVEDHPGDAVLETNIGGERLIEIPSGEDLPRIC